MSIDDTFSFNGLPINRDASELVFADFSKTIFGNKSYRDHLKTFSFFYIKKTNPLFSGICLRRYNEGFVFNVYRLTWRKFL